MKSFVFIYIYSILAIINVLSGVVLQFVAIRVDYRYHYFLKKRYGTGIF